MLNKGQRSAQRGTIENRKPFEGRSVTYTVAYQSQAEAESIALVFAEGGLDVELDLQGPIYRVIAHDYSNPLNAQYFEKWSWAKDIESRSIWRLPVVAEQTIADPRDFKGAVTDALETEAEPEEYDALNPLQQTLFRHLANDESQFEFEAPVMTRSRELRVIPSDQSPTPFRPIQWSDTIYTGAQLITAFAVPVAMQRIMPPVPETPDPDHIWGWRVTGQEGEYVNRLQFSELTTFKFSLWSNALYTAA